VTLRNIKVVTFDLDNTLWDVEPALIAAERAQNQWLRDHRPRLFEHFTSSALREFRFGVYQRHPELVHQISKIRMQALYEAQIQCGYADPEAREGANSAFAQFLKWRHRVRPYEQALEVLQELSLHYTLGALTNGNADIFSLDIGEYFDFAFTAEQLDASKPLPDMFLASLSETSAHSTQVVHVGDNPEHDVRGAQEVGLYTVWMNASGEEWPGGERADEEIKALQELPGAIARIEQRGQQ
jgi:HAD superfamily hydrolase (TIGR01549 family)